VLGTHTQIPAIPVTKVTSQQANSDVLKLLYYGVYKIRKNKKFWERNNSPTFPT
jgi:hypothetical protein